MTEYYVHPNLNNIDVLYKFENTSVYFWHRDHWKETSLIYVVKQKVEKYQIINHPAFVKEKFYDELLNDK